MMFLQKIQKWVTYIIDLLQLQTPKQTPTTKTTMQQQNADPPLSRWAGPARLGNDNLNFEEADKIRAGLWAKNVFINDGDRTWNRRAGQGGATAPPPRGLTPTWEGWAPSLLPTSIFQRFKSILLNKGPVSTCPLKMVRIVLRL